MHEDSAVALVTHHGNLAGGGRERYLADLALELRRTGHDPRFFCEEAPAGRGEETLEPMTVARGSRALGRRLSSWRSAHPGRPVLSARPLLEATHYQLHSGLYSLALAAEREILDSGLRRLLYWPATRWNRRRSALLRIEEAMFASAARPRLMVWSKALRDELIRRYGIASEEIRVASLGVDLSLFHPGRDHVAAPRRSAGHELLLLAVAHNFALKGLRCALEALGELKSRGLKARLLVAGGGPVSSFRRLAARLGVASRVDFLGSVPRERLPAFYRACDALVHPTFYDPFSLVALEALACGCPVITTRRNGASQLIEEGKQGFLLGDPRDSQALADRISALGDPVARREMRAAAAQLGSRFGFTAHAREVMSWLEISSEVSKAEADSFTGSRALGR